MLKPTVAFGSFSGDRSDLFRAAMMAATPSCRVNAVDYEALRQRGDEGMADYIVEGTIGEMTLKQQEMAITKKMGYAASAKFTLIMKDAVTGNQVATRSSTLSGVGNTEEEAISAAFEVSQLDMFMLINNGCKLQIKVLEVIETNKKGNKAEVISIEGGAAIGLTNFIFFDIQVETEISGHKTYKKIGRAAVKEVLGDDVALLKVRSGDKDVMTALQEGKTVVVTSRAPSLIEEAEFVFSFKTICE